MRKCELVELGSVDYMSTFALQKRLVADRLQGRIPDQFLIVEHPPVITMGRNAQPHNLLKSKDELARLGVALHQSDRGGDVTYHGPGQIVGYPILNLAEWKSDVRAYVSGLEQVIIDALAEFGIRAGREPGLRGVWVNGRKIAAIGIHISRWITSHGFALNHTTELSYFGYIVPCGLNKPVTSIQQEGAGPPHTEVVAALARQFGRVFECQVVEKPKPVTEAS